MISLPLYQIDAFASAVFKGNPAAVVPMDSWLPDATLQNIAAENNLAETAFFTPDGDDWRLRWFTPTVEVDLCGHATLATAHLIFTRLKPAATNLRFQTRSGLLQVSRDGDDLVLDFPSVPAAPLKDAAAAAALAEALDAWPSASFVATDHMAVFEREEDVAALKPDMRRVAALGRRGVIATAPGRKCDFVSRFFAPSHGIPEDPVTGSAHCTLTPYWAQRLGKKKLHARQISTRIGELRCEDRGERVAIAGRAVLYLEGTIHI
jgi:PhzF family phenazine biosynthesis protein